MHWPLEHVNCDELHNDECEPAMRWRTSQNRHTHERQGVGNGLNEMAAIWLKRLERLAWGSHTREVLAQLHDDLCGHHGMVTRQYLFPILCTHSCSQTFAATPCCTGKSSRCCRSPSRRRRCTGSLCCRPSVQPIEKSTRPQGCCLSSA